MQHDDTGKIGPEELNSRKITHASIKMTTNPTPPQHWSPSLGASSARLNSTPASPLLKRR